MQTLGELFRSTREAKGLSIKQVSGNIKIRESLLENLENGEYFAFSSDMHLRGFLRSYASFLNINEEKALAMYRRERQISSEQQQKRIVNENTFINKIITFLFNVRTLLSAVIFTFLFVVVWFFVSQYQAFNKPPVLEIISPSPNEILQTDSFVIEGFTESPSIKVVLDGNQANYIETTGRFRINAKFFQPGEKRFSILAENELGKKTSVNLDLTYRPEIKQESATYKVRFTNKSTKEFQVNYQKDSEALKVLAILPSETKEIPFKNILNVKNFDKIALALFFNEDINPTTSVDSKEFSVTIENNRPVFQIKK